MPALVGARYLRTHLPAQAAGAYVWTVDDRRRLERVAELGVEG